MPIVVIANPKGGVGKSTLSTNVAGYFASQGHEVMLEMPMEPSGYPDNDPGPYTLLASGGPEDVQSRMAWLLSRATGYFGVTNYLGDRFAGSDTGMNAFLSKPLDMARLITEVRRVIAEAGGQVPEVASAGIPEPSIDWPAIDGIDMLAARQLLSGDHGLFMGLLERFLRDTASLPGELPAWSRDPAADRRQALLARLHKLRGAAGALGANDVAGVSQRLELALRQGAPAEDLTQALADALARLAVAGGRAVAAHARDQAQAQDRQPTAAAPTPRQLQSLGALLQRQDLDALDHYGELAAGIRQLAGVESEAALRDAVQSLDFARAQRLLDAITPLAAES